MLHPDRSVVVDVPQLAHGIRGTLRHRRRRQEVVRRGARRLEEEALHRRDAAVGPVRKQHQGHRGAVLTVVAVVLPQRSTATVLLADPTHRRDELVVLGVLRSSLVAEHVVAGPPVGHRPARLGTLAQRSPRVHRAVALGRAAVEWQRLVHPAEHEQARQGDHAGSDRTLVGRQLGRRPSVLCRVDQPRDEFECSDHHQEVPGQVDERQEARIPQQSDPRQAVTGHVHQPHERQADQPERRTRQIASQDHGDEPDDRERRDDEVEWRGEREEHVPERVGRALGPEPVLHVGHVFVAEQEWTDPPRRQQQHGQPGRQRVDEPTAVDPDEAQDRRTHRHEDQHDPVRDRGKRQHHCSPHPEPSGSQTVREQSQAEHGQGERDREGILAGHRRLHVAAVDRIALVEQETQRRDGEQFRNRVSEVGEASERPAGQGEQDQARHCDQLECDAVGQDHVEGHDRQRRDHHVEAVDRQTAVPVHGPTGQLEVRQQRVAEIGRRPHVGAHVAARRGGAVEHEVAAGRQRVQVHHHHHDHGGGDEDG